MLQATALPFSLATRAWCLFMNIRPTLAAWALAAALVPLGSPDAWHLLQFRGIPRHVVRFGDDSLRIEVCRSAMPLIHRLAQPAAVSRVSARGFIEGTLRVSASDQGRKGFDDYSLRIGIVEAGGRRLGWLDRLVAPPWLRALFALAPRDVGIERVRFLTVGVAASQIGQTRIHPLHDLLHEHVVAAPDARGRFALDEALVPAPTVLGIWLAADGDDTRSCYAITLERLELL